jgi:hypothetical protein
MSSGQISRDGALSAVTGFFFLTKVAVSAMKKKYEKEAQDD